MPYLPSEVGIQQADNRPYGANAAALEEQRARRQIEEGSSRATAQPAPGPQPGPPPGPPNPGPPMDPNPFGFAWDALVNAPKHAWESVEQIPKALREYADSVAKDPLSIANPVSPKVWYERGKALFAVAAPIGAAFTPITDTARRAVVESDPVLRSMYTQHLNSLPEEQRGDSLTRANAYNAVFDRAKDALGEVANDPNTPWNDRLAAGVVSGLMQTQEIAEFGGPSAAARIPRALAWLRGTAPTVAAKAGLTNLERMVAEGKDFTRVSKEEAAASEAAAPSVVGKERAAQTPAQSVITVMNLPEARQTQNLGKIAQASIEENRRKVVTQALRWGTIVDLKDPVAVKRYATRGNTVLTRIDDMIETIQNEVSGRGMTSPQAFLDQLLDARALVAKQLADIKAARASELDQLKTARVAETKAGAGLAKAARIESTAEQGVRSAELGALKTDIQGRSAVEGAQAKGEQRVAKADETTATATEKVAAKAQSESEKIAEFRVQTQARIAELRQQSTDASITSVQREQARMEALSLSIRERRAALLEQKQTSADRVSFAGDQAPEYGYLNADDRATFNKTNIHIGKQESPLVGETIAETLRRAEAAGEDIRKQHLSWDAVAGEMVRKFGERDDAALIDRVQKGLRDSPTKGEQAALYQAADKSITRLSETARTAFSTGTAEEGKIAAARLLQFIEDFRDAVGESARATASRRLVNKSASADLVQGTSTLRASRARLADAGRKLAELDRVSAEASTAGQSRLEAIAKAETRREALIAVREAAIAATVTAKETAAASRQTERVRALQRQIDSVEELRARLQSEHDDLAAKWEARVQDALKDVDEARTAHDLAQQQVADAARRLQETIVQRRAAQMALTTDKMKVILQLDPENVAGFVRAIRDQDIQKKGNLVNTFVLTNMFGGAGQIANAIGNTVSFAMNEGAYRPLSRVTAALPPYRVKVGGRASVTGGEVEAAYAGAASALMDASQFVVRTMAHGEAVEIAAARGLLEITTEGASALGVSGRPAVAGLKGLPVEWPRRLLVSMDGFTRILATSGEASARVWRDAGGGKSGAKALAEFKSNPSIKQLEMANEYSGRVTFNEPPTPGSRTDLIVRLVNSEVGETGLRPGIWLIPVVRFGLNAAAATVRLSGGGLVSGLRSASRGREALSAGNEELALTLGRRAAMESAQGLVGVSMLAGGFLLADNDLLTGIAPTDPKALQTWKQQKKEEMSLNVMGHWVPLSLFGPAAAPLLVATLLRDQSNPEKDTDRLERAAMGLGKFASDIPAVSGFYDLLSFANNISRNGFNSAAEMYVGRILSRFQPYMSTARALVPVFDDTVREPEDILQRLKANYPGLTSEVPAAIDPYTGDPLRRYSAPLGFSAVGQAAPTKVQELIDAGHALVRPSNRLAGETLTDPEWHQYQEFAGKERSVGLAAVQASVEYKAEKDSKVRQAMLDLADSKAMDKARLRLATSLVNAAKTPQENIRALKILVVEGGTLGSRALTLDDYKTRLTPQVVAALDEARTPSAQGDYPPAISEYLRAAPLIRAYLDLPPFRVGDEIEWQRYVQARALRTGLAADLRAANNGKDVDERILNKEIRKKDVRAAELLAKYDDERTANPARKRILDANPWLERYVSAYRYTQKR